MIINFPKTVIMAEHVMFDFDKERFFLWFGDTTIDVYDFGVNGGLIATIDIEETPYGPSVFGVKRTVRNYIANE